MSRLEHCDFDDDGCCEICKQKNDGVYYRVVEGTKYCSRHGGDSSANSIKNEQANLYRTQVFQQRLRMMANADGIKSVRDEIAVLRMLLEELLNRAGAQAEADGLLMFSTRIQNVAQNIAKLLLAADRLERSMGQNLDRPTAMQFAAKLVEIVAKHETNAEILDKISADVLELLR